MMIDRSPSRKEYMVYEGDEDCAVEFVSDFDELLAETEDGIPLFALADLDAAIGAWDQEADASSTEEAARIRALRRLRRDPRSLLRRPLIADEAMLDRLAGLRLAAPNFATVTDLVVRAAQLSMATRSPLILPPILLLGEPGVGKSHYARRLAEAIQTTIHVVAGTTLGDRGTITGLSPLWRGARPGCVAKALLAAKNTSPVIVFDEADKAHAYDDHRIAEVLLTLLETETARAFSDEYLAVPMKADGIIWILTANDVSSLSAPLLDRLITIQVSPATRDQRNHILAAIFRDVNARHGDAFEGLDADALPELADMSSRRVRTTLTLALGFAAVAGRQRVTADDIAAARRFVGGEEPRTPVGFRMSARAMPR